MNIDRTKLMEKELNNPETFKHFPSKGDNYYFYTSSKGVICSNIATSDDLRVNVFKSKEEADNAYNKAVALEKVKRRIIKLQGDWKPDWTVIDERKVYIVYSHLSGKLETYYVYLIQNFGAFPYMKNEEIASTIIKEMEVELKLIFDIA